MLLAQVLEMENWDNWCGKCACLNNHQAGGFLSFFCFSFFLFLKKDFYKNGLCYGFVQGVEWGYLLAALGT